MRGAADLKATASAADPKNQKMLPPTLLTWFGLLFKCFDMFLGGLFIFFDDFFMVLYVF